MARLIHKGLPRKAPVYDVSVDDTQCFFATTAQNPLEGLLVHNCHRLSKVATDALLKPMEDTLPGTTDKRLVCMLCTTDPRSLRPAIKSRTMQFETRRPSREEMVANLRKICTLESVEAEEDALGIIVDNFDTHIRDMINFMEKAAHLGPISVKTVSGLLRLDLRTQYLNMLLCVPDKLPEAFEILSGLLQEVEPSEFADGLLEVSTTAYLLGSGFSGARMPPAEQELSRQLFEKHGSRLVAIGTRLSKFPYRATRAAAQCEFQVITMLLSGEAIPSSALPVVTTSPSETKPEQSPSETEPPPKPEPNPKLLVIPDDEEGDRFAQFSRAPEVQRRKQNTKTRSEFSSDTATDPKLLKDQHIAGEVRRHLSDFNTGGWSARPKE